jgi:hypothetical protein
MYVIDSEGDDEYDGDTRCSDVGCCCCDAQFDQDRELLLGSREIWAAFATVAGLVCVAGIGVLISGTTNPLLGFAMCDGVREF